MTRVTMEIKDVTAWRGSRSSADMTAGLAALVLTDREGIYPDTIVELVGSRAELEHLKRSLVEALESDCW